MPKNLIAHRAKNSAPNIQLFSGAPFVLGRVHEICGPARVVMAVQLASKSHGVILWIKPKWLSEQLLPAGLQEILDPARVLYVNVDQDKDILWAMEEALRSGATPTVIAELATPPALTPIRRLQLAAESGARRGHKPSLVIILTPAMGGAQGVETRWHAAPVHGTNGAKWHLTRTRSRLAPVTEWILGGEYFLPCQ